MASRNVGTSENDREAATGISTRIPAYQGEALDVLAEVMGQKKADLIRMAIDEFIERRTTPQSVEQLAEEMKERMLRQAAEAARRIPRRP